ncbi:MAG: hypothetical protein AAF293_01690, partial [Pseudomonadota bacterium]
VPPTAPVQTERSVQPGDGQTQRPDRQPVRQATPPQNRATPTAQLPSIAYPPLGRPLSSPADYDGPVPEYPIGEHYAALERNPLVGDDLSDAVNAFYRARHANAERVAIENLGTLIEVDQGLLDAVTLENPERAQEIGEQIRPLILSPNPTQATPNAYRRYQPFSFCPTNTTWGIDNRTVGLRVIHGSDSAVRVEKRTGAADCNPYLLLAAEIAAGLDGIEQGMTPTAETTGNGYLDEEAAPLPADIATAIELARGSAWLKGVLGDLIHELLLQQADREVEFVASQVTPVELDRYLGNF